MQKIKIFATKSKVLGGHVNPGAIIASQQILHNGEKTLKFPTAGTCEVDLPFPHFFFFLFWMTPFVFHSSVPFTFLVT